MSKHEALKYDTILLKFRSLGCSLVNYSICILADILEGRSSPFVVFLDEVADIYSESGVCGQLGAVGGWPIRLSR